MARSIGQRNEAGAAEGLGSRAFCALLEHAIDYAGMFPPASLSCDVAIANYCRYRAGEHRWVLGRFVIPRVQFGSAPPDLNYTVLTDAHCKGASAIETKQVVRYPVDTYCEVPLGELDALKDVRGFAKLRTGGVTPDAIPSIDAVAEFISACAQRQLPFKATAGLHHAIRGEHALTYEPAAPVATMHGFVNVFVAAAFAWAGYGDFRPILEETDPVAFRFGDRLHWRSLSLGCEQIEDCRKNFLHSFGSCSFEEPIADLKTLGWL